jgi:histidinol-phosphate aminotransferase
MLGGPAAADNVYEGLRERGILIRRYSHGPLLGCLRVSVGTEEQNAILLKEMERLCPTW